MSKAAFTAFASVALATSPAVAAHPTVLTRTGPWQMDYRDDYCALSTSFGAGSDALVLRFSRTGPGAGMRMALYGSSLHNDEPSGPIMVTFGNGEPTRYKAFYGTAGTLHMLLVASLAMVKLQAPDSDIDPAQEAAITAVDLKFQGRAVRLETKSLGAPMKAMRTCTDNLLKHWGYEPIVPGPRARAAMPLTDPATWLSDTDFPDGLLGLNSIVDFRLDVDAAGKVVGCHVLTTMKMVGFEATTCLLITRRALLSPALDANGNPIKGAYISTVVWNTSQ